MLIIYQQLRIKLVVFNWLHIIIYTGQTQYAKLTRVGCETDI